MSTSGVGTKGRKTRGGAVRAPKKQTVGFITMTTTGEISAQRLCYRTLFAEICSLDPVWSTLAQPERDRFAANFERICNNCVVSEATEKGYPASFDNPKFVHRYSDVGYRIISAIRRTVTLGEESLLARCVNKSVQMGDLGSFTMIELDPEATQILRDYLALRAQQKVDEEPSTLYKCGKCGISKTKRQTYQSRSGDEGETCLITCMNCQNYWYIH